MSGFLKRLSLRPRTLWGQTLSVTIAAVVLAQILTLVLFNMLILRPEMQRVARATAQSLAAVSDSIREAPPAERARLIEHLSTSGWIELWRGATPPDDRGPRLRMMERVFMRELADALRGQSDLYWRTDHQRKLWLHVWLGPDPYWVSVKSPPQMGPTGLMALCTVISALLAAMVAWTVSSRLLRPLHELKSASERMRLSDLPPPLSEDGPEDVAAVSKSFNLMTARLRAADAERALILAGISHDVRTPLAKLKLAFAMMDCQDDDLQKSAERQIETIDRILSQFLTFARGYEAEVLSPLNLRQLLSDMRDLYAGSGLRITDMPDSNLLCRPEAVRRAVMNLIENAIRYGAAPIDLSANPSAEGWDICVRDHGPGVPPDKLANLREPFVRGDEARGPDTLGTGLGLAIADKIAQLHGGRLELRNLAPGFEAKLILISRQPL